MYVRVCVCVCSETYCDISIRRNLSLILLVYKQKIIQKKTINKIIIPFVGMSLALTQHLQ